MTALSDALRAAQAQAIAALSKAYVADSLGDLPAAQDTLREALNNCGCTDRVEQDQLLAALETLKLFGAQAPEPAKPDTSHEPATKAQADYIAKLADERGTTAPDYTLTKANASKVIEQLKAGTYNPDEWTVPF